nr:TLRbeta3 [Terebratalia transversa]
MYCTLICTLLFYIGCVLIVVNTIIQTGYHLETSHIVDSVHKFNSTEVYRNRAHYNKKCPPKCPPHCHCLHHYKYMRCRSPKMEKIPPVISSSVETVDVQYNKPIPKSTFKNYSNVITLSLIVYPNVSDSDISTAAFQHLNVQHFQFIIHRPGRTLLTSKKVLDISCQLIHLTQLNLTGTFNVDYTETFPSLPSLLFKCLENRNLSYLQLAKNTYPFLGDYVFTPLKRLSTLNLYSNGLKSPLNPLAFAGLINLRELQLYGNQLTDFPCFLRNRSDHGSSAVPNLEILILSNNAITSVKKEDTYGLPSLKILFLNYNGLFKLTGYNFEPLGPTLKYLYLQNNQIRDVNKYSFKGLFRLEKLNFPNSGWKIKRDDAPYLFEDLGLLKELVLKAADIANFRSKDIRAMLNVLIGLEHLNLEKVRLYSIPPTTFHHMHNLSKLVLSDNFLSHLPEDLFFNLTNLKVLQLNHNRISQVSTKTFPDGFLDSLESIDLSGNPFACGCSLHWFLQWMNSTNVKVVGSQRFSYKCSSPPALRGKSLHEYYYKYRQNCLPAKNFNIILVASVSGSCFLALLVSVICIVYRSRWYIRYLFYLLRARRKRQRMAKRNDEKDFAYDAFVCYNKDDQDWVVRRLLPELEYNGEFKLCLHDRDFMPGIDIIDNIIESMEQSRRTILILSNSFAQSQWCQWELSMAQHKVLQDEGDILVLVLLEQIRSDNMSLKLHYLMRTKTYIEWTDNEDGRKLFWEKLKGTLKAKTEPPESAC